MVFCPFCCQSHLNRKIFPFLSFLNSNSSAINFRNLEKYGYSFAVLLFIHFPIHIRISHSCHLFWLLFVNKRIFAQPLAFLFIYVILHLFLFCSSVFIQSGFSMLTSRLFCSMLRGLSRVQPGVHLKMVNSDQKF
jgi:hypothetical protein